MHVVVGHGVRGFGSRRPRLLEWFGTLGSGEYCRNCRATCQWLADDLRGVVTLRQMANELGIEMFAGPLAPRQACELITAAART